MHLLLRKVVLFSGVLALTVVGAAWSLGGVVQGATLTVNTTADVIADNGLCSLREAIINANNDDQSGSSDCAAGSGNDNINLPAGTYILSIAGPGEDGAATGDLDITGDVVINGAGAPTTTIDGVNIDRVLHIISGNVTIADVTIRNGNTSEFGGGMFINGWLTLTDSVVTNNVAARFGGGILVTALGRLDLNESTVSLNQAEQGGGIDSDGIVSLSRSVVRENLGNAASGAGGGIFNGGLHLYWPCIAGAGAELGIDNGVDILLA